MSDSPVCAQPQFSPSVGEAVEWRVGETAQAVRDGRVSRDLLQGTLFPHRGLGLGVNPKGFTVGSMPSWSSCSPDGAVVALSEFC